MLGINDMEVIMARYHHIMVATEQLPLDQRSLLWIKKLMLQNHAKLSLLHAMPKYSQGAAYALPSVESIEKREIKKAKQSLRETAKSLGVTEGDQRVEIGDCAKAILQAAKREQVDLLVLNIKHVHHLETIIKKVNCDILGM